MDRLRAWFVAHGGSFHPSLVLEQQGPFGVSVLAPRLDGDTTVVTCPFSLIITKHASLHALKAILGPDAHTALDAWSDRQLICAYLCFHQLCPEQSFPEVLRHFEYVRCLPSATDLLTSLYFTTSERDVLRGTNLYGATLDREREGRAHWEQCRVLIQSVDPAWGAAFTWDMYLAALTHLSSRAFPSTILSPDPSLVSTPSTHPVLIPGADLLNHKRGQPVSWIVSCDDASHDLYTSAANTVAIVVHPKPDSALAQGELIEVFNNYGAKSNGEFILGYGFSLADNPDDTMVLQIAGVAAAQKWEVGRNARGVGGLWSEIRNIVEEGDGEDPFGDDLEAAWVLLDMVLAKLNHTKTVTDVRRSEGVRPAVRVMLEHYVAGQREILKSIFAFADEKRRTTIRTAREQGIDLGSDEDDGVYSLPEVD